MSERLETKRCINARYKYSSFPFPFFFTDDRQHIITIHEVCNARVSTFSKKVGLGGLAHLVATLVRLTKLLTLCVHP